jgi:hypothetical protein
MRFGDRQPGQAPHLETFTLDLAKDVTSENSPSIDKFTLASGTRSIAFRS